MISKSLSQLAASQLVLALMVNTNGVLVLMGAQLVRAWYTPIILTTSIQLPMCWCYNHETCTLLTGGRKEQSAYCFFLLEDIISRWVAVAVNSSQPPPTPPLCLEANPLISCVSMDLQRTIFYMRKREKKIHFIFFFFFCAWFVQPLQNGSSVIVLCSWEMIWILCRPEWEKTIFGLSVCVRSETRDFKASSVFMWITGIEMLPLFLYLLNLAAKTCYFCDHVRYLSFFVFKNPKLPST